MNDFSHSNSDQPVKIKPVVSRLCELWEIKSIEHEITIEFSSRITRSLGRTQPLRKIVRLNPDLLRSLSKHLEEVLCHEIAHIAAVHKYGPVVMPHGEEWQSLVRQAGFEPSVCLAERQAKNRMARWRCSACVQDGLDGELIIEEVL
jgi:predicted SprT family Zn-dependent metalloprotease